MKPAILAAGLAFAIAIGPAGAPAQSIILTSHPDGTGCAVLAPPGTSFTFYVFAFLFGSAADGITGTEFRIAGLPAGPGWTFTFLPNPAANLVLGSPLSGGVNIAFPSCQSGKLGRVLLGTVHGQNVSDPQGYVLHVRPRVPPSNPTFDCPLVTMCDAGFTKVCVASHPLLLNASVAVVTPPHSPLPADGAMGVSSNVGLSWQQGTIDACYWHSIPTQSLRFGTDPDPPVVWSGNENTYDPGALLPSTQYYWDVTLCYDGVCAASPLWSFRTDENVAAHRIDWTGLKHLFR